MMDQGNDDPKGKRTKPYKVGYGKPPAHSKFAKGRSGNPKGRPRGSKNKSVDLQGWAFRDTFLREAARPVPGQQGGKITMLDAAVRRTFADAIRGRSRAQELILRQMAQLSLADQELETEHIKVMMEAKALGEMELERRARLGLQDQPELIPHPDDIVFEPETGDLKVRGLYSKEERERFAGVREHAAVLREGLAGVNEMIASAESTSQRKELEEFRDATQARLEQVERALQ